MATTKTITTAFNAGELSPKIYGRVDLEQYYNGCKSMQNAIVYPQGGVTKRYGLEQLQNITFNDLYPESYEDVRIESFTFSSLEKYIVIFKGNGTILVYEVSVEPPKLVAQINGSPYVDGFLDSMSVVQSQDTMLITHYDVYPKQLIRYRRSDATEWRLENMPLANIPTYDFVTDPTNVWDEVTFTYNNFSNNDSYKITIDGVVNDCTFFITYSGYQNRNEDVSGTVANLQSVFGAGFTVTANYQTNNTFVGTTEYTWQTLTNITIEANTTGGGKALGVYSVPTDTSLFIVPVYDTASTTTEPVWSDVRGYPATCCIFQGRLWFGGSRSRPQTIWGSRSGSYFDFGVADPNNLLANDALDLTLSDTASNIIVNITSQKDLLVFTSGGVFRIGGDDNLITPSTVYGLKENEFGSKFAPSVQLDNSIFYLQNAGAQLNSLNYDFSRDTYITNPQALLSDHLLNNPIDLARITAGDDYNSNFMFVLNSDGTCALFNRLESQATSTWTPFTTDGVIKSICGVYSEMYCLIERESATTGEKEIYLERYLENNIFIDNYKHIVNETPSDLIPLQDRFMNAWGGKQIVALMDNYPVVFDYNIVGNISDGYNLQLPFAASDIYIGLPLDMVIETMPYAPNLQSGNARFNKKRVFTVTCDMYNSLGFYIEYAGRTYHVADRDMGFILNKPPQSVSKIQEVNLLGYNTEGNIKITSSEPVPVTLRSLQLEIKTTG
jgi:hypothetical protein